MELKSQLNLPYPGSEQIVELPREGGCEPTDLSQVCVSSMYTPTRTGSSEVAEVVTKRAACCRKVCK
jgi:hypothetical protein